MIKLLIKLFGLCVHKYETLETIRLSTHDGVYMHTNYHCRCNHCGKIKSFKVK